MRRTAAVTLGMVLVHYMALAAPHSLPVQGKDAQTSGAAWNTVINPAGSDADTHLSPPGNPTGIRAYYYDASRDQAPVPGDHSGEYGLKGTVAMDELQWVFTTALGGTFTLTCNGQTTGALAWNATAAQVQSALTALSSIGGGNVTVTGAGKAIDPWQIAFGGTLAQANLPQMTANSTGLTGGTATVSTKYEGGPVAPQGFDHLVAALTANGKTVADVKIRWTPASLGGDVQGANARWGDPLAGDWWYDAATQLELRCYRGASAGIYIDGIKIIDYPAFGNFWLCIDFHAVFQGGTNPTIFGWTDAVFPRSVANLTGTSATLAQAFLLDVGSSPTRLYFDSMDPPTQQDFGTWPHVGAYFNCRSGALQVLDPVMTGGAGVGIDQLAGVVINGGNPVSAGAEFAVQLPLRNSGAVTASAVSVQLFPQAPLGMGGTVPDGIAYYGSIVAGATAVAPVSGDTLQVKLGSDLPGNTAIPFGVLIAYSNGASAWDSFTVTTAPTGGAWTTAAHVAKISLNCGIEFNNPGNPSYRFSFEMTSDTTVTQVSVNRLGWVGPVVIDPEPQGYLVVNGPVFDVSYRENGSDREWRLECKVPDRTTWENTFANPGWYSITLTHSTRSATTTQVWYGKYDAGNQPITAGPGNAVPQPEAEPVLTQPAADAHLPSGNVTVQWPGTTDVNTMATHVAVQQRLPFTNASQEYLALSAAGSSQTFTVADGLWEAELAYAAAYGIPNLLTNADDIPLEIIRYSQRATRFTVGPTHSLAGTVTAANPPAGKDLYLLVRAKADQRGEEIVQLKLAGPGPYSVTGLPVFNGYEVAAFFDLNGDGKSDPSDLWTNYNNGALLNVDGNKTGIDLTFPAANFTGIDDFNDNIRGEMWYQVQFSADEWWAETNGRLELGATAAADCMETLYLPNRWGLDTQQDFAYQVDWHFAKTDGNDSWLALELGTGADNWIEIMVQCHQGSPFYQIDGRVGGEEMAFTMARDPLETDGTFYISFDASEDVLYLSKNGYWRPASADADWEFPGLVRNGWGAEMAGPHLGGTARQTPVVSGEAYLDNFHVSVGNIVDRPAAPRTLTIASTPNSGVPVWVSPDTNGNPIGGGLTPLARQVDASWLVVLVAPANDGQGNAFAEWRRNGAAFTTKPMVIGAAIEAGQTWTAVYGDAGPHYTISGYVKQGVTPLADVMLYGLPDNPTTDANGFYTASVNAGWTGTVTPQMAGKTFSPAARTYQNVSVNQADRDYRSFANADSDGDGLPDEWELAQFVNLSQTGWMDPDADGLVNEQEFWHNTNPNVIDTDGDGYRDLGEIVIGSDPTDPADPNHGVTITGTVSTGVPAAPLAGCLVMAVAKPATGGTWPPLCSSGLTAAAGTYSLTVPTGAEVVLIAMQADDYAPVPVAPYYWGQFHPGVTTPPEATVFASTIPATIPDVNFSLAPGALVSGTVTDVATGQPVANAAMDALSALDQHSLMRSRTRANGSYALVIPAATKVILQASHDWYRTRYWDNAVNSAAATFVTLPAGQALTGKNFALDFQSPALGPIQVGGMISGTISQPREIDACTFNAVAGQSLVIDVDARAIGSPLDTVLVLYGPDGNIIGRDDDGGDLAGCYEIEFQLTARRRGVATPAEFSYKAVVCPYDSRLYFTAPVTGQYRIEIGDYATLVEGGNSESYGENASYQLRLLPAADLPDTKPVSVSLLTPALATESLSLDSWNDAGFTGYDYDIAGKMPSQAALESRFPDGTYTVRADYGGGDVRQRTFVLGGTWPGFATITAPADNAVGIPVPVTIQWDAMSWPASPGNGGGAIEVMLAGQATPVGKEEWGQDYPYSLAAGSVGVPANQTVAGTACRAEIDFRGHSAQPVQEPGLDIQKATRSYVEFTTAEATPVLADDFNDNTRGEMWATMKLAPAEKYIVEDHQRLELRSAVTSSGYEVLYVGRHWTLDTSHDFAVKVDWNFGKTDGHDSWVGLSVNAPSGAAALDQVSYFEIGAGFNADFGARYLIDAAVSGQKIVDTSVSRSASSGTFYISYQASTDRLHLSVNDFWLPADAAGNRVFAGLVRGQLAASQLVVALNVNAIETAVGTEDQAYLDNFAVTQGTIITPPTHTLTVTSSPVAGAAIEVFLEQNGEPTGPAPTPFTRTYDEGGMILLKAPAMDPQGNPFLRWEVGLPAAAWSTARELQLIMDASKSARAVFAGANFMGLDDFNDNLRDTAKWGGGHGGLPAVLTEANGRLEYTATGATNDEWAGWIWTLNNGSYTRDWAVQIDVNVGDEPLSDGQRMEFTLGVGNAATGGDNALDISLSTERQGGITDRSFYATVFSAGAKMAPEKMTQATSTQGAVLRITFEAATKILKAWYSETTAPGTYNWHLLRQVEIDTTESNWNMSDSSSFRVTPYGASGNRTVQASGQVYADNFQTDSSIVPFTSGDGTAGNPYQITTLEQLQAVQYWLNHSFVLMNDLDASAAATWNNGAGFEPIGTEANPFTGTFNGQSHKVTNLTINRPSTADVGLFGYIGSGSTVENLGTEGGTVSGHFCVGGLIGRNNEGTVTNCYATGTVAASLSHAGGLMGASNGTVSSCYATGAVTCYYGYIGGLTGNVWGGTVTNCYATGATTSNWYVGGLVGVVNAAGTVANCYAAGLVTGANIIGGLVALNQGGSVSGSYYDQQTTGQNDTGKGTPKTTIEMKQQATFTNWNFADTWRIVENQSYPSLAWQASSVIGGEWTAAAHVSKISLNCGIEFNAPATAGTPIYRFSFEMTTDSTVTLVSVTRAGWTAPVVINPVPEENPVVGNLLFKTSHWVNGTACTWQLECDLPDRSAWENSFAAPGWYDITLTHGTRSVTTTHVWYGKYDAGNLPITAGPGNAVPQPEAEPVLTQPTIDAHLPSGSVTVQWPGTADANTMATHVAIKQRLPFTDVRQEYLTLSAAAGSQSYTLADGLWEAELAYAAAYGIPDPLTNADGIPLEIIRYSQRTTRFTVGPTHALAGTVTAGNPPAGKDLYLLIMAKSGQHAVDVVMLKLAGPGPYSVTGLPVFNGYEVAAFYDLNGDGKSDPNDLWTNYSNGALLNVDGDKTGIDLIFPTGGFAVDDDFNDNIRNERWYQVQPNPAGPAVAEAGQRLEVQGSTSADGFAFYASRHWHLSTAADFAVQADWHLAATGPGDREVILAVFADLKGQLGAIDTAKSVEIDAVYSGDAHYEMEPKWGDGVDHAVGAPRAATDGTFYISYDASLDRLHVSVNGYWREAGANGDWVVDGIVQGGWNADSVGIALGGEASGGAALANSEAFLDNFLVTQGTVVTPPTRTLTVTSTPSSAVPIQAGPDANGNPAFTANTPLNRSYDLGLCVSLFAPALDLQAKSFSEWQRDGKLVTHNQWIGAGLDTDQTWTTVYTIPQLTAVHLASSNANSATLAKIGDTVTVTFNASEPLQTPTVTLAGHPATPTATSGTTAWQASYTMTTNDSEGLIPFQIEFATLAGAAGTPVTGTMDSSQVRFDKTSPSAVIAPAPSQADPTTATPVNFTVTFSESVTGFTAADIQFTGTTAPGLLAAAVTPAGPAAVYQVAVTGMSASGEISLTFAPGVARDEAGNANLLPDGGTTRVSFFLVPPNWLMTIAATKADQANVQFGMHPLAVHDASFDEGLDLASPPPPGSSALAEIYFYDHTNFKYRRDLRAAHDAAVWFLEVFTRETATTLSWSPDLPEAAATLWLYQVDPAGSWVPGTMRNMARNLTVDVPADALQQFIVQSGGFPLILTPGWNMISLPVEPVNPSVNAVLAAGARDGAGGTVHVGAVWQWVPALPSGHYQAATEMHAQTGYCIYVVNAATLVVRGTPVPGDVSFQAGWNLLGSSALAPYPVNSALRGSAWGWDNRQNGYSTVGPGDRLEPGRSYWFFATQPGSAPLAP